MDVQDPKFFIDEAKLTNKKETLEDLLKTYADLQMAEQRKETLLCDRCHQE